MDFTRNVFRLIVCLYVFKTSTGFGILTSSPEHVQEYSSLVLTCKYHGSDNLYGYYLYRNDGHVGATLRDCKDYEIDDSIYTVTCPDNRTLDITIKNVTKTMHGDIWQCKPIAENDQPESNKVKVHVQDKDADVNFNRGTIYLTVGGIVGGTVLLTAILTIILIRTCPGKAKKKQLQDGNVGNIVVPNAEELPEYINLEVAPRYEHACMANSGKSNSDTNLEVVPRYEHACMANSGPKPTSGIYDDTAVEVDIYHFIR